MTKNFTPGPWKWDEHRIPGEPAFLRGADGMSVVIRGSDLFDQTTPDAQLIASAPDLLRERDALKAQRDELIRAARYTVDMSNAFAECPNCGFTKHDRSGKRHSDDCPATVLGKAIAAAESETRS